MSVVIEGSQQLRIESEVGGLVRWRFAMLLNRLLRVTCLISV